MSVRLFAAAVAALLALEAAPAMAEQILQIEPPAASSPSSLTIGATATIKTGDILYWEDEHQVADVVLSGEVKAGSAFWGTALALPPAARLRRSTFDGRIVYCVRMSAPAGGGGFACLGDADNNGDFETGWKLLPDRDARDNHISVGSAQNQTFAAPIAYKAENGFGSGAGLRAVYRYRGLIGGALRISCTLEPKAPLPEALAELSRQNPDLFAERTIIANAPAAGASVTVALPLCLALDVLHKDRQQRRAPFKVRSLVGNRPATIDVTSADAGAISLRLVQPLSPWALVRAPEQGDTADLSIDQRAR